MILSDANVNFNLITWNRLVLLHGPPGTGKTTLCRALAQKVAIRLSDRYSHGKLVEINSHSLFSKWFSESGKLVQRLFAMVTEMVEDEHGFVVILIDEVESLTAARSTSVSGGEPSDALRVVNAVLTQLDKLKQRKNVLIMTTSNISQSIDGAFVDRADIKQYVGPPPPQAIYWILKSCLDELMRSGLAAQQQLLPWHKLQVAQQGSIHVVSSPAEGINASERLKELAERCQVSAEPICSLDDLTDQRSQSPCLAHQHSTGCFRPHTASPASTSPGTLHYRFSAATASGGLD